MFLSVSPLKIINRSIVIIHFMARTAVFEIKGGSIQDRASARTADFGTPKRQEGVLKHLCQSYLPIELFSKSINELYAFCPVINRRFFVVVFRTWLL